MPIYRCQIFANTLVHAVSVNHKECALLAEPGRSAQDSRLPSGKNLERSRRAAVDPKPMVATLRTELNMV
jgi:hypothetical protein